MDVFGKVLGFLARNKSALVVGGLAVGGALVGVAVANSMNAPTNIVTTDDNGVEIVEGAWVETTEVAETQPSEA